MKCICHEKKPECDCSSVTCANAPGLYERVMCRLRGLRTLLTGLLLAVGGLLDQYQLVDIMAFVKTYFGDNARIGVILVCVAVGFIVLRIVTKRPVSFRAFKGVDEGA